MSDTRITEKSKNDARIHYVTSFIGGFLGIFPLLSIARLFGSAQTSNLIEVVLSALQMDWTSLLMHLFGMFLYAFAVFLVTFLPAHTKINIKFMALVVDVATAFFMWKIPADLPPVFYMYPTFFAMAFQWTAFTGAYGYVSSTIFSTNNLKQFVSATTEFLFNGKKEFKLKAAFYGAALLSFHMGVAASFVLNRIFASDVSFLFVMVPAVLDGILLSKNLKLQEKS